MREYLRYHCWDFILCALSSIGLSVTVLSAFLTEDPGRWLPMLILVSAVLSFVCLLAAYNRTLSVVAIIVGAAAAILLLIMSWSSGAFSGETENEALVFYAVSVVTTLVVFLLCRCRGGIIVLLLVGNVAGAEVARLGYPYRIWAYILFLAAMAAMFFYLVYVRTVLESHSGKARLKGFLLQNVVVVLVALLLSSGIFFGIVQPLAPPAEDLTLMRSSTTQTEEEEAPAQQEPEEERTTREMTENRQDESAGRILVPDTEEEERNTGLAAASEETAPERTISSALKRYWWVLVIVIAAVIVFLILLRRALRRRWLAAIGRLPRTDGVYNLYRLFLFGIGKSGCKRASSLTLEEFWESREPQLRKFDTEGVDFGRITEIYRKVYFGRQPVSEDEYADYLTYYKGFHKHVRREAGFWRYLILYFRL